MFEKSILIVEDDEDLLEALAVTFHSEEFKTDTATGVLQAFNLIKSNNYTIVLSDINLGELSGLDLLQMMKSNHIKTPIILMTAYGKISDAVKAIQLGAFDYIAKPFSSEQILNKIKKLEEKQVSNKSLVYEDEKTKKLIALANQVAQTDASVLISGESGTGKEVIAQYIHRQSKRTGEFVAINCAAIPENMLEAILFGYEKGAFTGAFQATEGKLEIANNGTLLLDEITEMPLGLQAKLLRVLQEKEVERIGGKKAIKMNIRIIATTNRNLAEEVAKGHFRQDLYFRLNVFPLYIEPLRDRKHDILPLANYFLAKITVNPDQSLNVHAQAKLKKYNWPGNVRELQNVIHRAIILANGNYIDSEHILFDSIETSDVHMKKPASLSESLENQENEMILSTLKACQGNREQCAEQLGVSTRTLRYKIAKMKKLGML